MTARPSLTRFSDDRIYRYTLYREWPAENAREGCVMFIGLNPSTADEVKDDPTIRRCKGFARSWGFRRMFMLNLFAFRATNPREMMAATDPIGPDNDRWLCEHAESSAIVVAAWGRHGEFQGRDRAVRRFLRKIYQIGDAEYPRHPLYLKSDLVPVEVGR